MSFLNYSPPTVRCCGDHRFCLLCSSAITDALHSSPSVRVTRLGLRSNTPIAYRTGKREALQDVLEFLQASLDHPAAHDGATGSSTSATAAGAPAPQVNTTARLIDYLEVRYASNPKTHCELTRLFA